MINKKRIALLSLAVVLLSAIFPVCTLFHNGFFAPPKIVPLNRAHSHNDYTQERPLDDALDHGFCSVEVDIHLIKGKLLVAHEADQIQMERTLQSLYLEPLCKRVSENNGWVYPDGPQFTLLIDIKSDAEVTYKALRQVLKEYDGILTTFNSESQIDRAVIAILSGNRSRQIMEQDTLRYSAYDGRLEDLDSKAPPTFIPLISDRWTKYFTWKGEGPMPDEERQKLRVIVKTAHLQGRRMRFWETPDRPSPARKAVWRELLLADVDLINTEDLHGLQQFLLENDTLMSR